MKKIELKNDIPVFGFEVKSFPVGIGDAFDKLVKKLPEGFGRDYYGISFLIESVFLRQSRTVSVAYSPFVIVYLSS